jgi:riboflavin kinase / FMN adenylyltransferase
LIIFVNKFDTLNKAQNLSKKAISLVNTGNFQAFAKTLGYYYFIEGHVISGNKIGRELGFPTANIQVKEGFAIPANGVYAALAQVDNKWCQAMVNVGVRPTLNLTSITIEAHLLNFNETIYEEEIRVHFISKIREEIKFPGTDELKSQLIKDKKTIISYLKKENILIKTEENICIFNQ